MTRFLALTLFLSSCSAEHLTRIEPDVDLQPATVDFGEVLLGASARRELTLTNRTAAPVEIALAVGPPFTLAASRIVLAGGEARSISVELLATRAGHLEAEFGASPVGTSVLRAEAIERAGCGPAGPCQSFGADCALLPSPDGTACTQACLTAGTCIAGRCTGRPLDCDDHDSCTSDACGVDGCSHAPASCTAPSDPCKAARCDATLGCVAQDVSDGTSCGVNDCTTALVCVSGRCVARPAPEGSSCAAASGCREASRCLAGECVSTGTRPLFPTWTFPVQGGLGLTGLRADDDGNVYFVERIGPEPLRAIVSLDAAGRLRFRVPSALSQHDSPLVLVSGDVVVLGSTVHLFGANQPLLEVRSTRDGALLWSTSYERLFPVLAPVLCSSVPYTWIGADGEGHLLVRASMHSHCTDVGVGFAVVDLHSGAVISQRQTAPWPNTLVSRRAVIDSQGRWVYVEPDGSSLGAWTVAGTRSWNTNPISGPLAATPGGRLITEDGTLLFPMGRAVAGNALGVGWPGGGALTGRLERTFFLTEGGGVEAVQKFDLVAVRSLWQRIVSGPAGTIPFGFLGVMTARDSVVFPVQGQYSELEELSWDGEELSRCTLLSQDLTRVTPAGQAVLLQGRWVTYDSVHASIAAFDVAGLAPAEHGWMTTLGTQGGELRPR